MTIESESANGSGFNNTEFTTLKIAVFAPMPSVRIQSADTVNPGFLPSTRTACASDLKGSLMKNLLDVH